MNEFKPITTQEELDSALAERLERKQRTVEEKYESYTSPDDLEKLKNGYDLRIKELETEIANNKNKIAEYESDSVKTRIAMEMGLPAELRDRLKGSNEDELREDAKLLAGFSKRKTPLATSEPSDSKKTSRREEMRRMIKDLGI